MKVTDCFIVEYVDASGQVIGSEYCTMLVEQSPEEEAREERELARQAAMFAVSLLPAYYLLFKVRQLTPKLALPSVRPLEELIQWSRSRVNAIAVISHLVAVLQIAQNLISKLMTRIRRCLPRIFARLLGQEVQP
jgi:hypothetical protein